MGVEFRPRAFLRHWPSAFWRPLAEPTSTNSDAEDTRPGPRFGHLSPRWGFFLSRQPGPRVKLLITTDIILELSKNFSLQYQTPQTPTLPIEMALANKQAIKLRLFLSTVTTHVYANFTKPIKKIATKCSK